LSNENQTAFDIDPPMRVKNDVVQIGVRKMVNRCGCVIGVRSIDEGLLQIEYIF